MMSEHEKKDLTLVVDDAMMLCHSDVGTSELWAALIGVEDMP